MIRALACPCPQLSFEEETLNRHRKLLRTAVAPERDYTMDGLLYYRLQNDIRKKVGGVLVLCCMRSS